MTFLFSVWQKASRGLKEGKGHQQELPALFLMKRQHCKKSFEAESILLADECLNEWIAREVRSSVNKGRVCMRHTIGLSGKARCIFFYSFRCKNASWLSQQPNNMYLSERWFIGWGSGYVCGYTELLILGTITDCFLCLWS